MLINELSYLLNFIIAAFLHIWPYLLVTIPLAVAVNMSGAANYINRAFNARPVIAIFLATAVGAFSPFCSCGVIPVVAALLIGGVPLGPVMSFWIASPSMDPETFFLSAATIGWELAVWRLGGTLFLSLAAGFITQAWWQQGWLGQTVLRTQHVSSSASQWELLQTGWQNLRRKFSFGVTAPQPIAAFSAAECCGGRPLTLVDAGPSAQLSSAPESPACGCGSPSTGDSRGKSAPFHQRLFDETWGATTMVIKFMLLAFFLEALIIRYVPSEWIAGVLGRDNPLAIVTAALIGVPMYTTNMAALPMISGLLTQGMSPAAALAFLVAGPTTTLPAMAAGWGVTTRRVFGLYVVFALLGAMGLGSPTR
jgi:uncharacterized membrane protein YraQ (UPF0718 family)